MISSGSPYKLEVSLKQIDGVVVGDADLSTSFYLKVFVENRYVGFTSRRKPNKLGVIALDEYNKSGKDSISIGGGGGAATATATANADNTHPTLEEGGVEDDAGGFSDIQVFSPRAAKLFIQLILSDNTLIEPEETVIAELYVDLKHAELNKRGDYNRSFMKMNTNSLQKSKETLQFSLMLEEDMGLVKIVNTKDSNKGDEYHMSGDDSIRNFSGLELHGREYPPSLIKILKDYEYIFEDAFDPYFIDDIVEDSASFLTKTRFNANPRKGYRGVIPISAYCCNNNLNDEMSGMIGSFAYDFTSYPRFPVRLHAPMRNLGVELIIQDHSTSSAGAKMSKFIKYYIKVGNKYVMWNLWRWLNIAFDFWQGHIQEEDLPAWIKSNPDMNIRASVNISSQSNTVSEDDRKGGLYVSHDKDGENITGESATIDLNCFVKGSLRKPFKLWQESTNMASKVGAGASITNISIEYLVRACLALDFPRPRTHVMELKIEGAIENDKPINSDPSYRSDSVNSNNTDISTSSNDSMSSSSSLSSISSSSSSSSGNPQENLDQFGPKGHFGFRRWVRKTVHHTGTAIKTGFEATGSVIKSGAGAVKDGVMAVPTLATNVASNVAVTVTSTTGSAVRAVTSGDASLLAGNLFLSLKGVSKSLVDTISNKLGSRYFNYVIVKYGPIKHIGVVPYMDNEDEQMVENTITIDVDAGDIEMMSESASDGGGSAAGDGSKTKKKKGSDLTYDGRAEVYFFNPISGKAKMKRFIINKVIPVTGERSSDFKDVKLLNLSQSVGLSITLLKGEGLMVHDKLLGNIHVRGTYANEFGSTPKGFPEYRSPTFTSSANPDFKETNFLLDSLEQICGASYARLMICGGNLVRNSTLGYVFIPIEDFSDKDSDHVYSVMKYKGAYGSGGQGGSDNIGKLFVRIKKITENSSDKDKIELKMSASLRPKSVFNTAWQADAFLLGSVDGKHAERFNVYASHRFLALFNENTWHEFYHQQKSSTWADIADIGSTEFDDEYDNNDTISEGSEQSVDQNETLTVAVFDNQSRSALPPFDWPTKTSHFSRAQDDIRMLDIIHKNIPFVDKRKFDSIDKVLPPENFEWIEGEDWVLDRFYTKTDTHGWSYGISMYQISQHMKTGKSNVSPNLMSCRRRKWKRKARRIVTPGSSSVHDLSSISNRISSSSSSSSQKSASVIGEHTDGNSDPNAPFLNEDSDVNSSGGGLRRIASVRRGSIKIDDIATPLSEREQTYRVNTNLILETCKEKKSNDQPVLIPWNRIVSYGCVTDTVFYIHFKINRYFGVKNGIEIFRPAICELFIQSCPAKKLNFLIDERILSSGFRDQIYDAISKKDVFGSADIFKSNPDLSEDMIVKNGILMSKATESPVSTVLSVASEAFTKINDKINANENNTTQAKHHVDCRLKLYENLLLLNNLSCGHDFSKEQVDEVIETDINLSYKIEMPDEVDAANSRIEFLLDCAEMRVKDTLISGFQHFGEENKHALERALEIMINGYFLEIVNIFMTFFSNASKAKNSLLGKIKLIGTYMRQNDRLQTILEYALRNFNLVALPRPSLSHFLKLDTLLEWYSAILKTEMNGVVDNAFKAWTQGTDKERESQDIYKSNLAWFPIREKKSSGLFRSQLPEDVMTYLSHYVEYAKLNKDNISSSFIEKIWKADAKVALSYVASIKHFGDEYLKQLKCSFKVDDFKSIDIANDYYVVEEMVEWLCSVANDARRIVCKKSIRDSTMSIFESNTSEFSKIGMKAENSTRSVMDLLSGATSELSEGKSFQACSNLAISNIAILSIIFVSRLPSCKVNMMDANYFSEWRKSLNARSPTAAVVKAEDDKEQVASVMTLVENLLSFVEDKTDYVDEFCFASILEESISRLLTRLMYIIVEANESKAKWLPGSAEVVELRQAVSKLKESLKEFKFDNDNGSYRTFDLLDESNCVYSDCSAKVKSCLLRIQSNFHSIDRAFHLICAPQDSNEIEFASSYLLKEGIENPFFAYGFAQFMIACLNLRTDHQWSEENAKKLTQNSSLAQGAMSAIRRTSMVMFSGSSLPASNASEFPSIEAAIVSLRISAESFPKSYEVNLNLIPLEVRVFDFLDKHHASYKYLLKYSFSLDDLVTGPFADIRLLDKLLTQPSPTTSMISSISAPTVSVSSMFSSVLGAGYEKRSFPVLSFDGHATYETRESDVSEPDESEKSGVGGVFASILGALGKNSDDDSEGEDRDSSANTRTVQGEREAAAKLKTLEPDTTELDEGSNSDDEEENEGHFLRLYDFYIERHFEIDQACYLIISHGDFTEETAKEKSADWREYDHIKVPVPKLVLTPKELLEGSQAGIGKLMGKLNPTRIIHVKIEIFLEKSFFAFAGHDELIGSVSLIVDQSDFVSIVDEEYKIDFNNQSAKVKKILSKLKPEEIPVLRLSCFNK